MSSEKFIQLPLGEFSKLSSAFLATTLPVAIEALLYYQKLQTTKEKANDSDSFNRELIKFKDSSHSELTLDEEIEKQRGNPKFVLQKRPDGKSPVQLSADFSEFHKDCISESRCCWIGDKDVQCCNHVNSRNHVKSRHISLCETHMQIMEKQMNIKKRLSEEEEKELHHKVYNVMWPYFTKRINEIESHKVKGERESAELQLLYKMKSVIYTYRTLLNPGFGGFLEAIIEIFSSSLLEPTKDIVTKFGFAVACALGIFSIALIAVDTGNELLFGAIMFPVGLVATIYGVSVGVVTAAAAGATGAAFVIAATPPGWILAGAALVGSGAFLIGAGIYRKLKGVPSPPRENWSRITRILLG
ncbi:hypothetical protein PPL_03722 [Heterostelium album PN500]|uniref:Uncharacterized protein n=1 Tax=Heterostelium pallidum (strain ATCC 26659 / Pp 5 / PN500) TaxID=670386 RepID=D3B6H4_HETP5|nr:hypothetical protein PPL_03722 [Heterostelium album PN500]EFA82944.1 hypothetical protein PPL_03722 [Heterostelium album PN500]|eukprot:XP_020435061.1 hypothetical protein PPL_03722 [Heterostelium album PN500]